MKVHELKTWPGPFAALFDGTKRHEIREDDRGFEVGDELHLREYDHHAPPGYVHRNMSSTDATMVNPPPRGYTGRSLRFRVTYISRGGTWGLPANLCVMSIEDIAP